ncbi:MAG TPA: hypothetical protein VH415_04815, partial [Nitrososphaeraceae archaeon]
KEYHNQLFGDPQKRKDVVQCPMCGFFSLPYEPIFYLDTREGIEWAEWCEIISRCMGEENDAFIKAYNENINLQAEEVIEGSDVAIAVRLMIADKSDDWEFRDTPTALLVHLNLVAEANNIDRHTKYWPKTAARLSRCLKLLQRTFRDIGIEIRWVKDTYTVPFSCQIIKALLDSRSI